MERAMTQTQLFARVYQRKLAKQILRTIRMVRWAATVILAGAMYVSFDHQKHYLMSVGVAERAAFVIPIVLDAMTFLCVTVLATPAIQRSGYRAAAWVLVFTVSVSGTLNFLAPGNLIASLVFVAVVLMIPLSELVAGKVKPDFLEMDRLERAVDAVVEAVYVPTMTSAPTVESVPMATPAAMETPVPMAAPVPMEPAPTPELAPVADASSEDTSEPVKAPPVAPKRRAAPRTTVSSGVKRRPVPTSDAGPVVDATETELLPPRETPLAIEARAAGTVPVFSGQSA